MNFSVREADASNFSRFAQQVGRICNEGARGAFPLVHPLQQRTPWVATARAWGARNPAVEVPLQPDRLRRLGQAQQPSRGSAGHLTELRFWCPCGVEGVYIGVQPSGGTGQLGIPAVVSG